MPETATREHIDVQEVRNLLAHLEREHGFSTATFLASWARGAFHDPTWCYWLGVSLLASRMGLLMWPE